MRLHKMAIQGFRRLKDVEIVFGDATFLIGKNNLGKSTVLNAIEYLLTAKKRIDDNEYYSIIDSETGEQKTESNIIVFEAEFRNLPTDASTWRGFKGRIFQYESDDPADSKMSITYRKTYELGKDVVLELKSLKRLRKTEYENCRKPAEFISAGLSSTLISELLPDLDKNITAKESELLEQIDDIWDTNQEVEWFKNPGGIQQVVQSRLPRYVKIPADSAFNYIDGNKSALFSTLNQLFTDVRDTSENYAEAQRYLDLLSNELDPTNAQSEFGKMINELNGILGNVFHEAKIFATSDLSEPDDVIKPNFNVELSSNVKTKVSLQGSGLIRSAAFGILRYREKWLSEREDFSGRTLIIAFEEPEIFLHPSAANQMRKTIYDLSQIHSQIVCTTHSPYMIDLSEKPHQVLNSFSESINGINCIPFNITKAYKDLQSDDKAYLKMILKIDDSLARVFFTKNVIVVEGDSEEVLLKETISRLALAKKNEIYSQCEIIKARGKATIIGLAKYLVSMGINPIVVHDRDDETPGAKVFNEPISQAVGENGRIIQMIECTENELGYEAPSSEKPYKVYQKTLGWGETYAGIPERWRTKFEEIFSEYFEQS